MRSESIEVEIVGDEVRRYKRLKRELNHESEYKQVMDSIDVLDILHDKKVEDPKLVVTEDDFKNGYMLVRRGKKNYNRIELK